MTTEINSPFRSPFWQNLWTFFIGLPNVYISTFARMRFFHLPFQFSLFSLPPLKTRPKCCLNPLEFIKKFEMKLLLLVSVFSPFRCMYFKQTQPGIFQHIFKEFYNFYAQFLVLNKQKNLSNKNFFSDCKILIYFHCNLSFFLMFQCVLSVHIRIFLII